jgi:N-acetylglucosaminyldiphosphoundecaprenol N-acetyl-beta-D-mannosaminyltransferase
VDVPAGAFERDVHCLLGLPFDAIDMAGAVRRVRSAAETRQRVFISTPNLNFVIGCRSDARFRDSVIHSDLSVADGMPVVWVARLLGVPIRERVAGSSLFERLRQAPAHTLKVYFFGGTAGVAETACRRVNAESRGVACVGFESPGYGSVEELSRDACIERINASGADFLVVSLGAKKGQAWIERNRARLTVPAVSHLGAVLNFAAGTVLRAPQWMQRAGLEWTWRIKEELGLARRYLGDGLAFLWLLATRVLPLAWMIRRQRPSASELAAARIEIRESGQEMVVALRGPWTHANLDAVRAAFHEGARRDKRLRIDLEAATYVDASFLGLLLILYGVRSSRGMPLSCQPVNPQLRRTLKYACVDFLLDDTDTGGFHLGEVDELESTKIAA